MRKFLPILLLSAAMALPFSLRAQSTVYSTGFEFTTDNSTWQFANSDNGWYIGTAVNNGGSKALYISNDGGTSNAYTAFSAASSSYAYRTLTLTSGNYTVSFDWQCQGEGNYDYLRVFLAPSTATFTAGNANGITASGTPSGWIALDGGDVLSGSDTWQSAQHAFTVVTAGSYKLVFYWHNDGSMGSNPPAAVDNVSISAVSGGGTGSDCQTVSLPFSEGFESGALGCWTSEGSGNWTIGTGDHQTATGTHGGNYNAKITHSANNNATKLISPQLNLAGASSAQLSFWYINRAWSTDIDALRVYYRTSLTGSWQQLFETTEAHESWTQATVTLPGGAMQVAFEMTDNYGYGVGIDDVSITSNGSSSYCAAPTGLAVQTVSSSRIVVQWNAGSGSQWRIQLNGTVVGNTSTGSTYILNNLSANTLYTIGVATVCDDGTVSDYTTVTQRTTCGLVTTLPYTCDFEDMETSSTPACWTKGDDGIAQVVSGSSIASSGSNYLRFSGAAGDNYILLPGFMVNWTNVQLRFKCRPEYYTMAGCGSFSVGYISDGDQVTTLATYNYDDWTSNEYQEKTVSLAGLPSDAYIFMRHDATGTPYWWYVDDVTVETVGGGGSDDCTTVTIGDESSTTSTHFYPANTYYNYSLTQTILLASEIGGPMTIRSIDYYYSGSAASSSLTDVNIYIIPTSKTVFSSNSDIQTVTNAMLVYSGSLNCSQGWNRFYLTTPYDYSGSGNLIVVVDKNSGDYDGGTSSGYAFKTSACTGNKTLAWYGDPDDGNVDPTTGTASNESHFSKAVYTSRVVMRLSECGDGTPDPTPVTCDNPMTVPYSEGFEGVIGTGFNQYNDNAPTCWIPYTTGSYPLFTPHVTTTGNTFSSVHSGNNSLIMTAGAATSNYGNAYILMPEMNTPLNQLQLSFWFKPETASQGTLTVGYVTSDDISTFQSITAYPSSTAAGGLTFVLPLTDVPATATRIAFQWAGVSSSYYTCCIDDVTLEVNGCLPKPVPYTENFDALSGTSFYDVNGTGIVPDCWERNNLGPHVVDNMYTYCYSKSGGRSLSMMNNYYNGEAQGMEFLAMLPAMSVPLNELELSFWMCTGDEDPSDVLTVGYVTGDDFSTFTPIQSYASSSATVHATFEGQQPAGTGLDVTLSLSNLPATATRIVLKWASSSDYIRECCIDDISINHSLTQIETACGSYYWNATGMTYYQSGTYTAGNRTLQLTINPENYTVENTVCLSGSYQWHGMEYTAAGDYTYTTYDDNGCDYTEVLHLTANGCCQPVENLTASNVTTTSVTLTWDDTHNSVGTEYDIIYVEAGTQDSILIGSTNGAMTYTIEGLTSCIEYKFVVLSYCTNSNTPGRANIYVTTSPTVVSLPYTEDFENPDNSPTTCWSGSGVATQTSVITTHSGTHVFGSDQAYPEYPNQITAQIISPELVPSEDRIKVSFWYRGLGVQGSTLSFQVGHSSTTADSYAFFTFGNTQSAANSTDFAYYETYLPAGTKYVCIGVMSDNVGQGGYLLVDDFEVSAAPCTAVQNLAASDITVSSTTLTWDASANTGTTYSVTQDGVEISTGLTATSYTATGLTQNTEYTFAVTAHCSATEASSPATVTVTTLLTLTETACGSYLWHGQTYSASGTYTYGNEVLNLTIVHGVPVEETETACESFTWRGNTYSSSDDYVMSITDANGCPTTATLHLTINHNTQEDQLVTSCNSHTWHGNTYSSSGTYTYTSTGTNGCLHTEKLHLIINNCSTIEVTACESYLWHGKTLTSSGTYIHDNETLILTINHNSREDIIVEDPGPYSWYEHTNMTTSQNVSHTFPNANAEGCDHTVTLHLVITPAPLNLVKAYNCDTVTACDSYTWHGIPLGSSGRYILGTDTLQLTIRPGATGDTLASACNSFDWYEHTGLTDTVEVTHLFSAANGCDSVVTLHLDVMACSRQEVTACDSYTWRGFDLGSNGTYVAGNDTLVLDLQRSSTGDTSVVSCNTYFWNGEWRTESGEYTRTLTNAAGCDSVTTLHLTINACSTTALTICESYAWHGQTYTASGTYTDGTDTLLLTVNSRTYGAESVEACNSYVWHGTEYSTSGIYTHTGTNAMGCDSVATLTLTVNPCSTTTITACDSYTWHGVARTASGTYTDGTDTLLLTIHNSSAAEETVVTCDSYLWNSQSLTESGNYTRTSLNTAGCDSVATLHLTIRASTTGIESVTACDSYAWHGNTYTASGTHTYNTTNSMGCDSVATLHLTVNASTTGAETATACNIYLWNGQSLTESGNYTYNTNNSVGCDSVATLHLTVNACSTTELTVCDSYSWHGNTYSTSGTYSDGHDTLLLTVNRSTSAEVTAEACNRYTWHGTSYTHDGVYMYTTTNVAGCDSTVSLHLTLHHSVTVDTTVTACDSYMWNGGTYTHEGTYRYTTSSVYGCDSTTNLTLIINHSVTTRDTLVVGESDLPTYFGNREITEAGDYEIVGTTAAGCDSITLLHVEVNSTGIGDVRLADVNLYPNPTTGLVTVDAEGVERIEVMDMVGRRVALFTDTRVIDISHLPEGSYVLRITLPDGTAVRKVVKR